MKSQPFGLRAYPRGPHVVIEVTEPDGAQWEHVFDRERALAFAAQIMLSAYASSSLVHAEQVLAVMVAADGDSIEAASRLRVQFPKAPSSN